MEAKSIFNLINYNNGNFKSEAQSKFFNDVACAGEITVSGGQTYKNAWNWIVTVDSVGIVDVYKNTNKNRIKHRYYCCFSGCEKTGINST